MNPRLSLRGLKTFIVYLPAACIAAGLKHHYSHADAGTLSWILRPTAYLASVLGDHSFHFTAAAGWTTPDGAFIIAPACAGMNFLILLFGLGVLLFLHHFLSLRWQCLWYVAAFLIAYGATIVVNTFRVLISIRLFQADIYGAWITPDRLHHVAGIAIYFGALWVMVEGERAAVLRLAGVQTGREPHTGQKLRKSIWPVLLGYGIMTLLIPLLNGAAGRFGGRFLEHTALVTAVCLLVMTAVFLLRTISARLTGIPTRKTFGNKGSF